MSKHEEINELKRNRLDESAIQPITTQSIKYKRDCLTTYKEKIENSRKLSNRLAILISEKAINYIQKGKDATSNYATHNTKAEKLILGAKQEDIKSIEELNKVTMHPILEQNSLHAPKDYVTQELPKLYATASTDKIQKLAEKTKEPLKFKKMSAMSIQSEIIHIDNIVANIEERKRKNSLTLIELSNKLKTTKQEFEDAQKIYEHIVDTANKHIEFRQKLVAEIHKQLGNVRVYCRIRPTKSKSSIIHYPGKTVSIPLNTLIIGKDQKPFVFDRVFDEESDQASVFQEVYTFLQSALDGNNVSIIAYGPTGSGKTYTMVGNQQTQYIGKGELTNDAGILPRFGDHLFKELQRFKEMGGEVNILFSCLEIYNESIKDLISGEENLELLNNNPCIVKNQKWEKIDGPDSLVSHILKCNKQRVTEKTAQNDTSSRSHCIYFIKINNIVKGKITRGMISIIDLAGSERSNTKAPGSEDAAQHKRIQIEANYINKSLTVLGRILTMLTERKAKKNALCYRESKLTRLLQSTLNSDSKTLMFVNISPEEEQESQSKAALLFAQTASLIPKQ